MAQIKTETDYYIDSGENKYSLYKSLNKLDKKGNPMNKFCGDYSTLDQAVTALGRHYLQDKINSKEIWDIKEVAKLVKKVGEELGNEFKISKDNCN